MNRRHGDRPDETADPAPRRAVEDSDWLLGEDVSESVLGTEPTGRSEVWRRRAALGLIWLGRVLLVAWLLGIATARLLPGVWMAAPLEDGLPLHPITDVVMFLSIFFGFSLPLIALPFASGVWLYPSSDNTVRIPTVLGVRVLQAESLTSRVLCNLPGQGWGLTVRLVRDAEGRWALVADSGLWRDEEGSILLGILAILVWSAVTILVLAVSFEVAFPGTWAR